LSDYDTVEILFSAGSASDEEFASVYDSIFKNSLLELYIYEDIWTDGANLEIKSIKLTVEGANISTRDVASRSDRIDGASEGDSGSLTLYAPNLNIKSSSGIYTHSDNDAYASGDLELTANGSLDDITSGFVQVLLFPADITITDAKVDIKDSIIKAGNILIDVLSDSSDLYDDSETQGAYDEAVQEFFGSISMGAGVALSEATADLLVSGSSIEGDNIDFYANAQTDAEAIVLTYYAAVAYGHSTPTANIDISNGSQIKADGYLNMDTFAESDMSVSAQQALFGISNTVEKVNVTIAITYSNLISKINVSSNSSIESTGSTILNAYAYKSHDNGSSAAANGDGTLASPSISPSASSMWMRSSTEIPWSGAT